MPAIVITYKANHKRNHSVWYEGYVSANSESMSYHDLFLKAMEEIKMKMQTSQPDYQPPIVINIFKL